MSAQLPLLRRIRSAAVVVALAALVGSVLAPTAAMAAGTGTISGTVYGANDALLADVAVSFYDQQNDVWADLVYTDENGAYVSSDLQLGGYVVLFEPADSSYATEYWDNAALWEDATPVDVYGDTETGSISPTLGLATSSTGSIIGTVQDEDGYGVGGIPVDFYAGSDLVETDYTDDDGDFTVALEPGDYTINFNATGTAYLQEWYNDQPTIVTAEAVTVVEGEESSWLTAELDFDPDFDAEFGGSITGTITGFAGIPLQTRGVHLYSAGSEPSFIEDEFTDEDGVYSFTGLDAGSYLLKFEDAFGDGDYAIEWWENKATSDDADVIVLGEEEDKTLPAAALELVIAEGTAPIAGTVLGETQGGSTAPAANVDVVLYLSNGVEFDWTSTDSGGRFLLTDVPADDYYLEFAPESEAGLVGEWWDDKPTLEAATPITVVAGTPVTDLNAVLSRGASVQGTVTIAGDGGGPVEEARVYATTPRGDVLATTYTLEDGTYDLAGLPAGQFKLGFSAPQSLDGWYSDKLTLGTAKILTIEENGTLTGKDIALKRGASISGNIKGAANANLDNIEVYILNEYRDYVGWSSTDEDGNYLIAGLEAGKYTLQFANEYCEEWDEDVVCPPRYRTEFWDNKATLASATFITVAANQAVTGRNVVLALEPEPIEGATISGVVTGPDGAVAYKGVTLVDTRGEYVDYESTDESGAYEFNGIAPGKYTLAFEGDQWENLAPQYLGNKTTVAKATYFTVKNGQTLAGRNAKLAAGARIRGILTGDGEILQGTRVIAYNATEGYQGEAFTDEEGYYDLRGLAAGSYTVLFTDGDDNGESGPYSDEYYNNKSTFASSTKFALSAGQYKTGISADLALSASISGVVTAAEGHKLDYAYVYAYGAGMTRNDAPEAHVEADGSYLFDDLAPGSYKLYFENYGTVVSEWYNNKATQATATPVVVTPGQNLESINVSLEPGAVITGVVTNPSEELLDGVSVVLWQASGSKYVESKWARTDGLGEFSIPGLAPGKYKVSYNDYGTSSSTTGKGGLKYKEEYSDNKKTLASANIITVTGVTSFVKDAELAVRTALKVFTATPKPTLTGIARVENTLTVNTGAWKPAPVALSVQWLRDGEPIEGATTTSYTLTSDDLGTKVAASVTAIKVGYSTVTKTTVASATVQNPAIGVLTVGTPTFSGTLTAGSTLTATTGEWAPEEIEFSYQWKRAGVVIPGATASSYVVTTADVSKAITVTVTGNKEGYDPKSATSAAKTIGKTITTAPVPTLSGTPTVGQTLTAKPGTWKPAPVTLKYQWLRDGSPITGATKATYKLAAADADAEVSVQVTGSKAGYTSVVKESADVTIGRSFTLTPAPYLSGYVAVGSSVTAEVPVWSPEASFSYVWKLNGVVLPVTESEISVLPAYDGKSLTVTVTGSAEGYTPVSKTSAAYLVGKALTFTAAPVISGTPTVGQTLTAATEAWAPAPVKLSYQWKRNGASIAGATKASYKLTAADDGKSIFVTVTGSKTGYRAVTETSSAVVATKFTASPIPTIEGLKVLGEQSPGDTLTAVSGTWGPATVTLSYQWTRNGVPIVGATSSTHVLTPEDEGLQIRVAVTGSRSGYVSVTRTSTDFAYYS